MLLEWLCEQRGQTYTLDIMRLFPDSLEQQKFSTALLNPENPGAGNRQHVQIILVMPAMPTGGFWIGKFC
jgi:hypothetical protein